MKSLLGMGHYDVFIKSSQLLLEGFWQCLRFNQSEKKWRKFFHVLVAKIMIPKIVHQVFSMKISSSTFLY